MAKDAKALFAGKNIKKVESVSLDDLQNENKKIQSFMMEPGLKSLLADHFKEQGITWGAGLRMIIIDYLKREKRLK